MVVAGLISVNTALKVSAVAGAIGRHSCGAIAGRGFACYRRSMLRRRYPRVVCFYCTSRVYLLRIAAGQGIPGDIAEDIVHELLLSILWKRLRKSEVGPYLRGAMKHVEVRRDSDG